MRVCAVMHILLSEDCAVSDDGASALRLSSMPESSFFESEPGDEEEMVVTLMPNVPVMTRDLTDTVTRFVSGGVGGSEPSFLRYGISGRSTDRLKAARIKSVLRGSALELVVHARQERCHCVAVLRQRTTCESDRLCRRLDRFPNRETVHGEMPDRERLNARTSDDQAAYGEPTDRDGTDRKRTDCSRANRDRAYGCR